MLQSSLKNVIIEKLNTYLEEIMKADLTKVFSTIHLEQISSTTYNEIKKDDAKISETRILIYESIMKMIKPQADDWGIKVINFQLESTQLADQKYSLEYEAASLAIARSKADLKAAEAQNKLLKQKAETQAGITLLNAETEKKVQITKAQAVAESTIMQADATASAILKEGQAKAEAAGMMTSEYGQELSLLGEKTKIAGGLKIHTLVMGGKNQVEKGSMIDNVMPLLNV